MRRGVLALCLAVGAASGTSQAVAEAVRVDDQLDGSGPHAIVRLVVDNTGDQVGATVLHRGSAWQGRVRLELDVAGSDAPEYVAEIARGGDRARNRFQVVGVGRWRCSDRTASSRTGAARTVLSADRACLRDASRLRVRAVVTSAGGSSDSALSPVVPQQRRPNVVMIMVDDMRFDDLRYMPATRRLIGERGVSFRNALAPFPLCCPARSSVLTGRYSHNHGVFGVQPPYGFTSFGDSSTLATWLQRSGYATTYLGKYLNGYGREPAPGKDAGRSVDYVPPGWSDWRASIDGGIPRTHPKWGSTYYYFNTTLSNDGRGFTSLQGQYQTTAYGKLSADIIRRRAAADRPFFLYASYTAPHSGGPVEPDDPGVVTTAENRTNFETPARPDRVEGMFDHLLDDTPGWASVDAYDQTSGMASWMPEIAPKEYLAIRSLARQRAESLFVVDESVRRTIRSLELSGELDDTLVMFTSDNGYFLGEHRRRLGKQLPYDASLRVPLLMRGPGIPEGQNRLDPFLSIDFAPTIAEFAGVEPGSEVDGVSMLGVARAGDEGWSRPVVTDAGPLTAVTPGSVSDDYLKLSGEHRRDVREVIGLRTDRYLYVDLASGEEEMYDMAPDPDQAHNLIDDLSSDPELQQVHELLRAELARVAECRGEDCATPMPAALSTVPGESVLRPARVAASPNG